MRLREQSHSYLLKGIRHRYPMNAEKKTIEQIPFNFGTVSLTYDRWYKTPTGIANDWVQKSDMLHFLKPDRTNMRLLDAGCGTGHWSCFFADLGYDVVGVDVSEEQLQQAQSHRRKGLRFQKGNLCASLPFDANSFDVVTAMTTIEFVFSPLRALREMARCTRKGGRILIGALNCNAPLNRQRIIEEREPYVSGNLHSQEDLVHLLTPFGTVRMIGSDPEDFSPDPVSGKPEFRVHANAPLIIAEIQR